MSHHNLLGLWPFWKGFEDGRNSKSLFWQTFFENKKKSYHSFLAFSSSQVLIFLEASTFFYFGRFYIVICHIFIVKKSNIDKNFFDFFYPVLHHQHSKHHIIVSFFSILVKNDIFSIIVVKYRYEKSWKKICQIMFSNHLFYFLKTDPHWWGLERRHVWWYSSLWRNQKYR